MKIVCVSDTHNRVGKKFKMPAGDVLLHAGDATGNGNPQSLIEFDLWLGKIKHLYKHIIFVPGNHDLLFEKDFGLASSFITNATILHDKELVIDGVKFYGSAWTPEFFNWGFNLPRGKALAEKWAMIPDDVDVLITHGPPRGILDNAPRMVTHSPWGPVIESDEHVGCDDLLARLPALKNLKLHVFGHIHNGYGRIDGKPIFVNAATCDELYAAINPPVMVDL